MDVHPKFSDVWALVFMLALASPLTLRVILTLPKPERGYLRAPVYPAGTGYPSSHGHQSLVYEAKQYFAKGFCFSFVKAMSLNFGSSGEKQGCQPMVGWAGMVHIPTEVWRHLPVHLQGHQSGALWPSAFYH